MLPAWDRHAAGACPQCSPRGCKTPFHLGTQQPSWAGIREQTLTAGSERCTSEPGCRGKGAGKAGPGPSNFPQLPKTNFPGSIPKAWRVPGLSGKGVDPIWNNQQQAASSPHTWEQGSGRQGLRAPPWNPQNLHQLPQREQPANEACTGQGNTIGSRAVGHSPRCSGTGCWCC